MIFIYGVQSVSPSGRQGRKNPRWVAGDLKIHFQQTVTCIIQEKCRCCHVDGKPSQSNGGREEDKLSKRIAQLKNDQSDVEYAQTF